MKKIRFYFILLFSSLFLGCRNDLDRQLYRIENDKFCDNTYSSIKSIPSKFGINSTALAYYKDLEEVFFITKNRKNSNSSDLAISMCEINSFVNELKNIDIVDPSGKKISFFNMKESDQRIFLDNLTDFEAKEMTKKIKLAPQIEKIIAKKDQIIKNSLLLFRIYSADNYIFNNNNNIDSLCPIKNKPYKFSTFQHNAPSRCSGGKNNDTVSLEKTVSILSQYAERGNLLVRLAIDGYPEIVYDIEDNNPGHVGILTGKIQLNFARNDKISIAAQKKDPDGNSLREVRFENLNEWQRTSYIMEIGHIKIVWHYFYCELEFTPVNQPELLADKAEQYLGVRYVHSTEFLTAKYAVPAGFTCATLAWYCAEKVYGCNISLPIALCVAPEDIYLSWYTRIKAKIQS